MEPKKEPLTESYFYIDVYKRQEDNHADVIIEKPAELLEFL